MSDIHTTYDAHQHCTSVKESQEKKIAMDCPYTGKGEEFSPIDLVKSALGGCMLLSMSTFAMRHGINLSDTRIDVRITSTKQPRMRFKSIDIVVTMPADFAAADRASLEQAAESCPIKHSFAADIPIKVHYLYPE